MKAQSTNRARIGSRLRAASLLHWRTALGLAAASLLAQALALDVEVVGRRKWPAPAAGLALQGDYAYVTCEDAGLQVIDIRDPANPKHVRRSATQGWACVVAVAPNYAYLASDAGLEVVDLINLAGNGFHFLVSGEPGQTVRVQRSRNLKDWEDWQQVTLGAAPADVTDANTLSTPRGFYRAVAP